MLLARKSIDKAYESAAVVEVGNDSRFVIISDCHRGSGSLADDFAKNQMTNLAALRYYYKRDYTYIELGDGDELWKNKCFADISSMHSDIFMQLAQFFKEKRLYMLYGNHDLEKKYKPGLMDTLVDVSHKKSMPLFPGLSAVSGVRLKFDAGREVFLVHGHQADFFNDDLWRLARFLVRYIWKPLELIGYNNPTSAARNNKVKEKVEKSLMRWADEKKILLIAGHTHRPVFPEPGEGRYFNDGSCVHPWNITAMEISSGDICLVKWGQKTREDGTVYIGKDIIGGPRKIEDYFA